MNMINALLQLAAVASGLFAVANIAKSYYPAPEKTNRAYY